MMSQSPPDWRLFKCRSRGARLAALHFPAQRTCGSIHSKWEIDIVDDGGTVCPNASVSLWRSGLEKEVARLHGPRVGVDGEADVDARDRRCHDVADVNGLGVVALWKVQDRRWHHLLPSQAHVCAEDEDGGNVEKAPAEGLEDLELQTVDVANHGSVLQLAVRLPEEVDW